MFDELPKVGDTIKFNVMDDQPHMYKTLSGKIYKISSPNSWLLFLVSTVQGKTFTVDATTMFAIDRS